MKTTSTNVYINGAKHEVMARTNTNRYQAREYISTLQVKLRKASRQIKYLGKITIALAFVILGAIITISIQQVKLSNLEKQYDTLSSDLKAIQSDYTSLSFDHELLKSNMNLIYNEIKTLANTDVNNATDVITAYKEIATDYENLLMKYTITEKIPSNNGFVYNEDIPLSSELQEYAYNKCEESEIEYSILLGLMRKESNFKADAVSKTNDSGLCQINKVNHSWMREVFGANWDPLNAYDSIDAACYMLKNLIDKHPDLDTYHTLLMAYNMGYTGAKEKFKQGTYSTDYSRTIMEYAVEYGYTGDGYLK